MRDSEGNIVESIVSLKSKQALLAAVIISIVLSALISIIGLVVMVYALNKAFKIFANDSKHIKKYSENYDFGIEN